MKKKPQQVLEMLPDYDFSKGVRGKYAGRCAAARDTDVAQVWREEVYQRLQAEMGEVAPGKVLKSRRVGGKTMGARVTLKREEIVRAVRADRDAR